MQNDEILRRANLAWLLLSCITEVNDCSCVMTDNSNERTLPFMAVDLI